LLAGLLAGLSAAIANLLVAALARTLFPVPPDFRPFMPLPILAACLGGALGAAGVFGLLQRTSRNPRRSLILISMAVLLGSFIFPVRWLTAGGSGVGVEIMLTLMLMHAILAWLSVRALLRLAPKF
jgi:hypothetical protein